MVDIKTKNAANAAFLFYTPCYEREFLPERLLDFD